MLEMLTPVPPPLSLELTLELLLLLFPLLSTPDNELESATAFALAAASALTYDSLRVVPPTFWIWFKSKSALIPWTCVSWANSGQTAATAAMTAAIIIFLRIPVLLFCFLHFYSVSTLLTATLQPPTLNRQSSFLSRFCFSLCLFFMS